MSKPPKRVKIDLSAANHAISTIYEFPPTSNENFIFPEFALPRTARLAIVRRDIAQGQTIAQRHATLTKSVWDRSMRIVP